MKKLLFICFLFICSYNAKAQFGYGITTSLDFYNQYKNPTDDIADPTAGSALLNIGLGPKVWFGHKKLSLSLEAMANLGFFGLSTTDYKGLGTVSFPIIARLNFLGLSGLDMEGGQGFAIGGGIQYNKTELYYLSDKYEDQGVTRDFFKTYVVELAYGFGLSGANVQLVGRYGFHPDNDSRSLNIGLKIDLNFNLTKKIDKQESRLL